MKKEIMQLYPAIDIKGGQCVRLTQGKFNDVKVYSANPFEMAKYWEEQGATYLHLVDLDGALSGRLVNEETIRSIVNAVNIPIQIGGGIRNFETIETLLNMGITRVIIGTKAVENPEFMKEAVDKFGSDKIVAGVDAKDGMVAVEGWEKVSNITALDLCQQMKSYGIKHIVYTDISKDGMLNGPNFSHTSFLTEKTGLDIIASGGVSAMEDLQTLYEANIKGVIIGKALYEKRIDLKEAVLRFEQGEDTPQIYLNDYSANNEETPLQAYLDDHSANNKETPISTNKKILISLICENGTLLLDGERFDLSQVNNPGIDELLIYDASLTDDEREKNIKSIKEFIRIIDIPVILGGHVERFEDVKKYLYSGAFRVYLDASSESNIDLIKEVSDRFGSEKIAIYVRNASELKRIEEFMQLGASKIIMSGQLYSGNKEILKDLLEPTLILTYEERHLKNLLEDLSDFSVYGIAFKKGDTKYKDFMELKQYIKSNHIPMETLESRLEFSEFKLNSDGLIPVIVQEYKTDEVLMLAYMNEEAFHNTIHTGKMTYFSRSRNELWLKGETSGHYQYVKSLTLDCDKDTILAKVFQVGVACHTGSKNCFFQPITPKPYDHSNPLKLFEDLLGVIADRKENPKEGSYTNYLFDKGIDKILKKVGEEATEIIIAAKNPDTEEIKYEIADFLYHIMVLMVEKGVTWEEIMKELANR